MCCLAPPAVAHTHFHTPVHTHTQTEAWCCGVNSPFFEIHQEGESLRGSRYSTGILKKLKETEPFNNLWRTFIINRRVARPSCLVFHLHLQVFLRGLSPFSDFLVETSWKIKQKESGEEIFYIKYRLKTKIQLEVLKIKQSGFC